MATRVLNFNKFKKGHHKKYCDALLKLSQWLRRRSILKKLLTRIILFGFKNIPEARMTNGFPCTGYIGTPRPDSSNFITWSRVSLLFISYKFVKGFFIMGVYGENSHFCRIQLKFRFWLYNKRWHTSWKFQIEITSNKQVIAKTPLTNLYEMNSTCDLFYQGVFDWGKVDHSGVAPAHGGCHHRLVQKNLRNLLHVGRQYVPRPDINKVETWNATVTDTYYRASGNLSMLADSVFPALVEIK